MKNRITIILACLTIILASSTALLWVRSGQLIDDLKFETESFTNCVSELQNERNESHRLATRAIKAEAALWRHGLTPE